jgi:nitrogen fixation NifU-like protein
MLEHFENPRNVGTLDKAAPDVSTALEKSGQCGLVVRAQLQFGLDGRVVECRWKTLGCGALVGSMSWLSEWARGRALTELLAPPMALLTAQLALTGDRLHCGEFAATALRSAAEQALAKLAAK